MRTQLMMLTFIGTVAFAQGQNQSAPAVAEGPGVSQGESNETPQATPPGPGERGPQGRRFAGPDQQRGPGGPGERFANGGRGPLSGPMRDRGRGGMRPDGGGPEMAGGPGFGGGPEFSFEQGDEPGAMDGPEDEVVDYDDERGDGPELGGAPGFERSPEAFGPRREWGGFGGMSSPQRSLPPGAALQAVLGLEDKQVQTLRQLQREKARRLDEAQFQLRQKQDVLMDLLEQEDPDGTGLVAAVRSIHALRKQAGAIEKEFQAKTAAVLNDEQKARLHSFEESRQIPQAMQEAARFNLIRPMGTGRFPDE